MLWFFNVDKNQNNEKVNHRKIKTSKSKIDLKNPTNSYAVEMYNNSNIIRKKYVVRKKTYIRSWNYPDCFLKDDIILFWL